MFLPIVHNCARHTLISNIIYLAQDTKCDTYRKLYLNYALQLIELTTKEKLMQYNHIVFDLDGTLIDTENAVLKTWQYTLETYGLDYSLENLRIVLGIPTLDALELLDASVDQDFENKWIQNYSKFSDQAVFFPGAEDILQFMKKSGFHLGVVTSRKKTEYESYFRKFNLEQIFNLIVCADDTLQHKPDPEPLLYYAEKSGTTPDSCIYIGDMPTDIACANAAGFASGLVTWNHSSVLEPDADYIFSSPEDLLKLYNI
ncbi:haloacid dehalogenase superfamily, subfamily IA, variant 3 with third motif having DD or ED/haloacid dehalogenase superfamily, subfamily IA, variant 1 with third motif having Dx(3-4)D or Dx(3-4)E [Anaerovirgula multivorans]|uniref:Haloacid dehalogenase superfamily, subfamily IA, variant 3 with third motif having DD or ED/haloacid dehalogenase superfamily, subfamily IA, variant 1 with third motif having Dx(3-4)D or Dx(3-4)E n=1 Tax=Anaerovirgula multivorans TaxID=312168 RepID=A0A239C608_9FIRM|nr:HAD family hydrolase [Anaerovirgula multivorans]SNS15677.1 haloacid dehalogenase superfamily, subfamily IA, variant 3 with third motif having DD or ED/haloacid dehalogenase superfamily, subfamily IA, variant 1 with third motif having Dx(3-4)D or Dx(3-4)E [Anaerovirgula multivorans]